jgi:choline monooxygenase
MSSRHPPITPLWTAAEGVIPPLTHDELHRIAEPIETARTLPPRAFTDETFFEAERRRVFAAGWIALTFAADTPRSGDAKPIDALGTPVLVVRQLDGSIGVFHNLSPYDACPVLIDPVRGATDFVSPYHGWRFDLTGRLLAAPFWNGRPDAAAGDVGAERKDLTRIRSAVWCGVVFVDLGGKAPPFDTYIRPLLQRVPDLAEELLAADAEPSEPTDTAANWKTLFENTCINVYHEGFVHRLYKAAADVPRVDPNGCKTFEEICDDGLYGLGFTAGAALAAYGDSGLPLLPWRDPMAGQGCLIVSLYPSLHFAVMRDHIAITIALPLGPGVTRSRTWTLFAKAACSDEHAITRMLITQAMAAAGSEDARICEAIQSARRSLLAEASPYCPFWDRMHHDFTQRLAKAYTGPTLHQDA